MYIYVCIYMYIYICMYTYRTVSEGFYQDCLTEVLQAPALMTPI